MKVLLQRVNEASVTVDGKVIGEIGKGLLLLTGFGQEDNSSKLKPMAEKIIHLRIFSDESGKFNHSLREIEGAILVVPQFTLYADTTKGRRPEFFGSLGPNKARPMFLEFVEIFKSLGTKNVASGEFGADMRVRLENNGPVTIMLEA